MRVAIDCRYIRGAPSGIGTYVRAIVDRLPSGRGMDFVLWADRRAPHLLSPAANATQVTLRSGPNSPMFLLLPRWAASFDGIDLLHLPHNVLPRGIPCPTVVTVQDVLALDAPRLNRPGVERIRDAYYPQAVMRALHAATRVIVTTNATADRVLAWAPGAASRLRVIPLAPAGVFRAAVDPARSRRRAAALVGSDAEYVLAVGENTIHKGHNTAIDAFAAAAPSSWRLVLVLRLGSRRAVERLAERAGIRNRVVFLSGIADEEVAALMQHAAALIQPSRYEGFGLPVVEAMACGCPVVASDIAAIREVSGGAAVLVPPGDSAAFAAALRRLIESPAERRALTGRGIARAAHFSWDETARRTWDVYDEAARS